MITLCKKVSAESSQNPSYSDSAAIMQLCSYMKLFSIDIVQTASVVENDHRLNVDQFSRSH